MLYYGKSMALVMILSHGYTSVLMFYFIGEFYHIASRRLIYYLRGYFNISNRVILNNFYINSLFCRLASLLRFKNHAFGNVAKITVRCLQGLIQSLDLRTLVKINSDIVRTGLLTFFNNCADDLFSAVEELQNGGQYSLLRGQNLKSWVSLEFANQMIIPVLTTMFVHLAINHFGSDLLLDENSSSMLQNSGQCISSE
ncbi:hypothetical protein WUBG_17780 [Wuchereria bancrofti]|uniref:NADH:ubiquinone reductase (H(+)-translocating) n=1 Tax=Wuchereria bancrofti TaxID=6293 RepID=J9DP64_WUCBA|nr:hypothetical protein WUBG_17780 [Wuchereria bancrofti]